MRAVDKPYSQKVQVVNARNEAENNELKLQISTQKWSEKNTMTQSFAD